MVRRGLPFLGTLVVLLASATNGFAQNSHWGVGVSATPSWQITQRVKDFLADEDEVLNFEGSEFTIGAVRGSTRGGDISINFVRKPWKNGLGISSDSTDCFNPGPNQPQICLRDREQNFFDKVRLNGVEFDWFFAPRFGRIKDVVQIGLNVGGGIAKFSGSVRKVEDREEPVFVPGPGGGTVRINNNHTEETNTAEDELLPIFPLAKIELMGAVIATPAVKIKVAGGLNFPGSGFRVMGVYLFGAK
jgi:hypothetical protein